MRGEREECGEGEGGGVTGEGKVGGGGGGGKGERGLEREEEGKATRGNKKGAGRAKTCVIMTATSVNARTAPCLPACLPVCCD